MQAYRAEKTQKWRAYVFICKLKPTREANLQSLLAKEQLSSGKLETFNQVGEITKVFRNLILA